MLRILAVIDWLAYAIVIVFAGAFLLWCGSSLARIADSLAILASPPAVEAPH